MMYNQIVEQYFFYPEHTGVIDLSNPLSAHLRRGQRQQGMLIDFYMQCAGDGLIQKVCFKAMGNPYTIASLEFLCRHLEGENISSLPEFNYSMLVKIMDIPNTQYPVALQVEEIYKEILVLMRQKL